MRVRCGRRNDHHPPRGTRQRGPDPNTEHEQREGTNTNEGPEPNPKTGEKTTCLFHRPLALAPFGGDRLVPRLPKSPTTGQVGDVREGLLLSSVSEGLVCTSQSTVVMKDFVTIINHVSSSSLSITKGGFLTVSTGRRVLILSLLFHSAIIHGPEARDRKSLIIE